MIEMSDIVSLVMLGIYAVVGIAILREVKRNGQKSP